MGNPRSTPISTISGGKRLMGEKILEYDVVIIGSGAGGGTVAKELAPL